MRVTINRINERIKSYGFEIVKGNGYFYFCPLSQFDFLKDSSVYIYHLTDFSIDEWESQLIYKINETKNR